MLSNQWLLTIGWWWQNRRRWCEMNFEWNCSHKNSFSLFKYNKKFGYKQHKQSIGQWIRHLNLRVIHLYNFLVEFLVEFCSPETHTHKIALRLLITIFSLNTNPICVSILMWYTCIYTNLYIIQVTKKVQTLECSD